MLTPLIQATECGRHRASLSIRSGEGMATHDRLFRFTPVFRSPRAAARYALEYGLQYLRQDRRAATA